MRAWHAKEGIGELRYDDKHVNFVPGADRKQLAGDVRRISTGPDWQARKPRGLVALREWERWVTFTLTSGRKLSFRREGPPPAEGPKQKRLDGLEACVLMHSALRRCCDSSATSALWNLVFLVTNAELPAEINPWRVFGQLVADGVNSGVSADVVLQSIAEGNQLQCAVTTAQAEALRGNRKHTAPGVENALYAIVCVLRLFSKSDFQGMASYL